MKFLLARSSRLLRPLYQQPWSPVYWLLPLQIDVSLLTVQSMALPKLMKMIDNIRPDISLWRTLLLNSHYFKVLTVALWAQQSHKSFTHLGIYPWSMSPQLVSRGVMGDHFKSPAKVKANGVCCSLFVHKISHPIVEGNWVGQAQFVLGKSMLVVYQKSPSSSWKWLLWGFLRNIYRA